MALYDKLNIVESTIIKHINELINEKHKSMFNMWLDMDAGIEIIHIYQDTFKEHFGNYITEEVRGKLEIAAKSIAYVIKTFVSFNKDKYKLSELIQFVENYVSEQFNDFDNDFDATDWFYTGENDDQRDENPS